MNECYIKSDSIYISEWYRKEDMMNWKFKKDAEKQGSSDGFWYDITHGGYIKPEEVLADKKQLEQLEEALELVLSFENALNDNDLLEEF